MRTATPATYPGGRYGVGVTDDSNLHQAEFWDELAPAWAAGEHHTELVAGRFGALAIDRLDLEAGQRVLDVGCGTGATTLELARAVAPNGEALGVDISAAMVKIARDRGGAQDGARFEVADVQVDDVDAGPFDAAFSRFGVMFFADPAAAFVRIRTLLRPGGRLAFCCWQDLFSNEWMFVPGAAVIGVTGELPPMPGPGEPGPFSLADPAHVVALLSDAGFEDVDVTPQSELVVLPETNIESIVDMSRHVGPVHEALRDADDDLTSRVLAAVRDALLAKVTDGELRLSAAALIASARA
jgi:SAM-dependent methyltransferase